ncbi:MAG: FHA domain-containing protein [Pirellulales bacterium]|nr:FHA domain-containing protein [Pirellulales bacterium]
MRVILEVISGPSSGRKFVLGAFQTVQVGRTEMADFSVPHDGRMSSVHFALETDAGACYLKDLGSRNGTMLDGRPLGERTALRSDTEITAGSTAFRVRIESESAEAPRRGAESTVAGEKDIFATPAAASVAPALAAVPPHAAETRPAKRGKVTYALETCASGLVLCSGTLTDIRPTDLANLLGLKIPLHLIVDRRKIEAQPPGPPGVEDYLFNWIPPEAAALASPVVVSAAAYAEWPAIVELGWGKDAVVTLFSRYDKPGLMEHLRNCLRAKPQQADPSAGIVGYCWPGVMSMLLAQGMHHFVRSFFTGIEAVLIELPDLPEIWQFFGPTSSAKLLDELGFVRKEPVLGAST